MVNYRRENIMPRKDTIHDAVKNALVKEGWTVTNDPFRIHYNDMDLYADLRIEKDESENLPRRALVIEIKSFMEGSAAHSLGEALGQYELYRTLMRHVAPGDRLYLAVSNTVYIEQFVRASFQLIVQEHQVAIVVVNVEQEEVVRWID